MSKNEPMRKLKKKHDPKQRMEPENDDFQSWNLLFWLSAFIGRFHFCGSVHVPIFEGSSSVEIIWVLKFVFVTQTNANKRGEQDTKIPTLFSGGYSDVHYNIILLGHNLAHQLNFPH